MQSYWSQFCVTQVLFTSVLCIWTGLNFNMPIPEKTSRNFYINFCILVSTSFCVRTTNIWGFLSSCSLVTWLKGGGKGPKKTPILFFKVSFFLSRQGSFGVNWDVPMCFPVSPPQKTLLASFNQIYHLLDSETIHVLKNYFNFPITGRISCDS